MKVKKYKCGMCDPDHFCKIEVPDQTEKELLILNVTTDRVCLVTNLPGAFWEEDEEGE